jgi:hypothetical protein
MLIHGKYFAAPLCSNDNVVLCVAFFAACCICVGSALALQYYYLLASTQQPNKVRHMEYNVSSLFIDASQTAAPNLWLVHAEIERKRPFPRSPFFQPSHSI